MEISAVDSPKRSWIALLQLGLCAWQRDLAVDKVAPSKFRQEIFRHIQAIDGL